MKDRGGRRDSRMGGERGDVAGMKGRKGRGAGGRGGRSMESDRRRCLRTGGGLRRPNKFWSYYNYHNLQKRQNKNNC